MIRKWYAYDMIWGCQPCQVGGCLGDLKYWPTVKLSLRLTMAEAPEILDYSLCYLGIIPPFPLQHLLIFLPSSLSTEWGLRPGYAWPCALGRTDLFWDPCRPLGRFWANWTKTHFWIARTLDLQLHKSTWLCWWEKEGVVQLKVLHPFVTAWDSWVPYCPGALLMRPSKWLCIS